MQVLRVLDDFIIFLWIIPYVSETTKTPRREASRSEGGPNQRVGDEQAPRVGAAEPAAPRTERPLQSAARALKEPHSGTGKQELCCKLKFWLSFSLKLPKQRGFYPCLDLSNWHSIFHLI